MERHVRIRLSHAGPVHDLLLTPAGSTIPLSGGQLQLQTMAGTTFFFLSVKSWADLPVTLELAPHDDYVFFMWNGQVPLTPGVAGLPVINPYAFVGTRLSTTPLSLAWDAGKTAWQGFGFSPPAAGLLAEEFDGLQALTAMTQRFLPPKAHKFLDALRKADKRGFALNVHYKDNLYQLVKLYRASLSNLTVRRSVLEDEDRYIKARDLIALKYADPAFNVELLATEVGLSRSNLYRLFEKQECPSPYQLLLTTRLEKGRELLQQTNHSVFEIATLVGFEDADHFSRRYKILFGVNATDDR